MNTSQTPVNLSDANSSTVVKSAATADYATKEKLDILRQETEIPRSRCEQESGNITASNTSEDNTGVLPEKGPFSGSLAQSSMSPTVSDVTSVGSREEKEKSDLLNDTNGEESNCFCGKVSKGLAMIGCDYCSDWYHMQCVQITRAQAKAIEKYACPRCTSKDETLQTIYKDVESRERTRECLDRSYLKKKKKDREVKSELINDIKKTSKENCENFRLPPGCNNCINCFRDADWRCGKCAYCEAKREPCLKRVCILQKFNKLQMDKIAAFYGEKSPTEGRNTGGRLKAHNIKSKSTANCESMANAEGHCYGTEKSEETRSATSLPANESASGTLISGTISGTNNLTGKTGSGHGGEKKRGRKRGWKKNKSDSNLRKRKRSSDKEDNSSSDGGYVGTDRTLTLEERRKIASAAYFGFTQRNRRTPAKKEEERQCFGPGCTLSARPGSKYCSDTCGLNLAKKRLNTILPGRVNNYWEQLPCASVNSERQQAVLEEQLQQLTSDRRVIESYKEELQKWITSILNVEPKGDNNVDDGFDWDFVLHCAVCTLEFPAKQIAKHAERCFVRTEKQSCYGAPNKAVANPCNLYCEAYNKINKTYCKRLRVLCSEHYKPGIEDEIKVCGFPLIWNRSEYRPLCKMFADSSSFLSNGFCLRKRKQCYQHHNWIQNVMGLIDVELMNKLIKIDECLGKKRWLQITDKLRGDVLSLMCNDTVHQRSGARNCDVNSKTVDGGSEAKDHSSFPTEGGIETETAFGSFAKTEQAEVKWEPKDHSDYDDDKEDQKHKDSHLSEVEAQLPQQHSCERKSLSPSNTCDFVRDSLETVKQMEKGSGRSSSPLRPAEEGSNLRKCDLTR